MPRFEKFYVGPSMVDATGNLKLVNFFSLFQEIASRNSDEIGIGKDKTTDNNNNVTLIFYYIWLALFPFLYIDLRIALIDF